METTRHIKHIFASLLFLSFLGFITLSFKQSDGIGGKKGHKELGDDAPIRFDGVYYKHGIMRPGQQQGSGYTYLRFYPDKTVVMIASASEPEKITRNFGRAHNQGEGKFKLYEDKEGNGVRFTIKHFGVPQSYEGPVSRDTLRLRLYGGQSQFEYDDPYFFYKVDNMKE